MGSARPARPGRLDRPRWSFAPAQGCATFPEVEVNVTGQPFKGPEPDGARARLRRRPHPPRRVRVPRRPLPLRTSVEPVRSDRRDARLRRPLAQRRGRGRRELPHHRQPDRHAQPRRLAELRGLAARRVAHPRGHLLEVDRAGMAVGLRIMVNDLVENRALCEIYPLKQNDCNEMASAYKQAEDMYALQDYIDAQFGGPGKGFLRIVRSPDRGAQGDQRRASSPWCSASRCPRCSTAGSSTTSPQCTPRRSTRELDKLYVDRRAVAVPGPQVRQRARRHAVRLRARPACW